MSAGICLARATASEPLLTATTSQSSAAKVILMARRMVLLSSIARILVGIEAPSRQQGYHGAHERVNETRAPAAGRGRGPRGLPGTRPLRLVRSFRRIAGELAPGR